jgi:hypothetical protein
MTRSFRYTPLTVNVIRRHAQARRGAAAIATLMNCSQATIEGICLKHDIELVTIADGAAPLSPYKATDGGRPRFVMIDVPLGFEALELIRIEAARRGVRPATLIARVSEIVARDGLYAAVLDQ